MCHSHCWIVSLFYYFQLRFVLFFFCFNFGSVSLQHMKRIFRMSVVASYTCILMMCVSVCLMNLSLNFKDASLNSARLLLHYAAIFRLFFYSIMCRFFLFLSLFFFLSLVVVARGNGSQIYAQRVRYKRFHLLVIRNITGFLLFFLCANKIYAKIKSCK